MNDIGKRAHELIAELKKNGFNGFPVRDAEASCIDGWSEHYACVDGLFVDYYDAADEAGDYFDHAQFEYDFEIMLKNWFTFPDENTVQVRSYESGKRDSEFDDSDGLIMVRYRDRCNELEVYRMKNGKTLGFDETSD
jgi:hypothetical protein